MAYSLTSSTGDIRYQYDSGSLTVLSTGALALSAMECNGANNHIMQINLSTISSVGAYFICQMQATLDTAGTANWFNLTPLTSLSAVGQYAFIPYNSPLIYQPKIAYRAVRMNISGAGTTGAAFQVFYFGSKD